MLVTASTVAPLLARQPHRRQRVGGLARLGDPDHQVVGADHRVAVAVLGGDVHLDRDPRPLLDRVAADEPGVVAGAAGDDHDPADAGDQLRRELELGEVDGVERGQAVGDRLGDRVGLLVDLLQHEGRVAALLGRVLVPGDLEHVALDRVAVEVDDPGSVGVHGHDLAVLEPERRPGLREEGGDRRGDEGLALAEPDDQRALLARGDQGLWVVGVHGDEGVVAAHLRERGADGVGQVAVVVLLDQVGDDLSVGVGAEDVTVRGEVTAQLRVVLDDAVEHDVDVVGAVSVRVGVLLGHPPVRRPAGVAEADRRRRGRDRHGALPDRRDRLVGDQADGLAQVGEVADRAHGVDVAVREQRDARRVVAAVLELLEPGDDQITARTLAYVADDSAHGCGRVEAG